MTIDTLLADVSPLLPVSVQGNYPDLEIVDNKAVIVRIDRMNYFVHAANHFPAMLEALREIAELPSVDLDMATVIAKQAIAAATEVTQ